MKILTAIIGIVLAMVACEVLACLWDVRDSARSLHPMSVASFDESASGSTNGMTDIIIRKVTYGML